MLLQSSNYYLPIAFIYPTLNDLMRINCDMIAHLSCSFITSSSIYADLDYALFAAHFKTEKILSSQSVLLFVALNEHSKIKNQKSKI